MRKCIRFLAQLPDTDEMRGLCDQYNKFSIMLSDYGKVEESEKDAKDANDFLQFGKTYEIIIGEVD